MNVEIINIEEWEMQMASLKSTNGAEKTDGVIRFIMIEMSMISIVILAGNID